MSALKRHHPVDAESKLIVSGYVRLEHQSLFKSNRYALFENVPTQVSGWFAAYYDSYDLFDKIRSDMALSDGKKTIRRVVCKDNEYCYAHSNFGKMILNSTEQCICKWYLKIIEAEGYPKLIIGVSSSYARNVYR